MSIVQAKFDNDFLDVLRYGVRVTGITNNWRLGRTECLRKSDLTEEDLTAIYEKYYCKKEKEMNKIIASVFEKTTEAVLVDKFFTHEIGQSFTNELVLKANKEAYLAEANRREEEQKKKNVYGPECVKGTI
jgi:hypothetical protein